MNDSLPRRLIGVVTTSRSDFGLLSALIETLRQDVEISVLLYVTGMHHCVRYGETINEIREQGFGDIIVSIPSAPEDDSPRAVGSAMAGVLDGFNKIFSESPPDILLVMGDRIDMIPAIVTALPHRIPVAHVSGGELSERAFDDSVRHAVTKMSHLHFVSHPQFAQRVHQMGEENWRIVISGEPGLDNISAVATKSRDDVYEELGLSQDLSTSLFTFHPETLGSEDPGEQIKMILSAAQEIKGQIVFTYPNNDPGSDHIVRAIVNFCEHKPHCQVHKSLGRVRYLNLLQHIDCMVGNSSSGLVEAASFRLPVVNIGQRQKGRLAPRNVISADVERISILNAWHKALSPEFKVEIGSMSNPYGDGNASHRIVETLKNVELGDRLLSKTFQNIDG